MGWFWGRTDASNPDRDESDPLRDLDPSLRDFLKKESPVKYTISKPAEPKIPEPAPTTAAAADAETKPLVPKESLFQDGRYAYLWKNYKPMAEVEAEGKSDADKIQDVIEGYKYRKAEIGRAALENCAIEQWDVSDCFKNGGLKQRLTLCRTENRKFERCYVMQSKFLKALGYMSTFERPPEVDEKIQMHADTLFHRMLEQEAVVKAAEEAGQPVPELPSVIEMAKKAKTTDQALAEEGKIKPEELSEKVQKKFEKRLEKLSGTARDLEERAIRAEMKAGEEVSESLTKLYAKRDEERKKRMEQGAQTLADRVAAVLRPSK